MSLNTWQETLISNIGVGPTVTATTITSILPTSAVYLYPANSLIAGKRFRITADGVMNTTVTSPGTLTFTVNFGAVAAFVSQAMLLNIVAKSQVHWKLELILECLTTGSVTASTMKGYGYFSSEAVIGSPLPSVGGSGTLLIPLGAPVAGTGFNSIGSNAIDLLATNTVNNSMILHGYSLESMN